MGDEPNNFRQGMARQSSFARSFFSSQANPPALEQQGEPAFPGQSSGNDRRSSGARHSSRSNTQSFGMAAAAAATQSDFAEAGGGNVDGGWNDDEVLEQYRLMAQHEANLRVMENTGFDAKEYERRRKLGGTETKDKKALYGGGKKPKQKLPEPRNITATGRDFVLRPVEPPRPPALEHRRFVEQKVQRAPDLCPGEVFRGGSANHLPPDENVVKCLGSCNQQLRVKRLATLVSCPVCHVVSPATSSRR